VNLELTIWTQHNNDTTMVLALLARLTAPPTQTLRTLQPTPSTVSFTVSTRPVPATLAAKLSYYVGLLTRLMLGACVLLFLWTKWCTSYSQSTDTLLFLLGGPRTAALLEGIGGLWWGYAGPGAITVLYLVLRRGYTGMFTSEPAFSTRTNTTQKNP
jgi:phosphatidylinositol glycan class H protein